MVSAGFMLVCPCVCSRRARATSTLTVSLMTRQRQMRSSPVGTATSNNRGLRIKVEGLRIKGPQELPNMDPNHNICTWTWLPLDIP